MNKNLALLTVACLVILAGCATTPKEQDKNGVLANYCYDKAVVFNVSGYPGKGSISMTLPKAVKNPDGSIKPSTADVFLCGHERYWVELTKIGCMFPYSKGWVWIDKFEKDTLVEGTKYDFGIYAR